LSKDFDEKKLKV